MAREDHAHLLDALAAIDPATLDYQQWLECGMSLHESGYSWQDWDEWSARDHARYHEGECRAKWEGFGNGADKVSSGSLIRLAEARGWRQPTSGMGDALDWGDMGTVQAGPDVTSAETMPLMDADEGDWDPCRMLYDYIDALFEDSEHVGYVTESFERDGRKLPTKGCWDRTAGQLKEELAKYGDMGAVLGDWDESAGAWIRFNPLDGEGCGNTNVIDRRYALVESDVLDMDRQFPAIKELNLPCAAVVSSGGKSVHAIVRVDASSTEEYRNRVRWLYDYCDRHGFVTDKNNKNESRLSRMPGATRNGKRQLLLATNIGASSWDEWKKWAEESEDDLPDEESLAVLMNDPPPLAEELIEGVLRRGHKMMLSAPSKSGKSFLMQQLTMAVASGRTWLGKKCKRGKVLYVNLEIDRASLVERFISIAKDSLWTGVMRESDWDNITVWTLRGHVTAMDKLAPSIVRRGRNKGYSLVIIDPIYKVITGDENKASDMSFFLNHFDYICHELGCSVAFCHHYSKGTQAGKYAMDRASGSGVFNRDPDAQLAMTPLDIDAKRQEQLGSTTCWRIEYTLREFESPKPTNVYFRHPVHVVDNDGALDRYELDGADPDKAKRERRDRARKERVEKGRREKVDAITAAIQECKDENVIPTIENVLEHIGSVGEIENVNKRHLRDWCNPDRSGDWTPFRIDIVQGIENVIVDTREE